MAGRFLLGRDKAYPLFEYLKTAIFVYIVLTRLEKGRRYIKTRGVLPSIRDLWKWLNEVRRLPSKKIIAERCVPRLASVAACTAPSSCAKESGDRVGEGATPN